jgi:hypothetical protein
MCAKHFSPVQFALPPARPDWDREKAARLDFHPSQCWLSSLGKLIRTLALLDDCTAPCGGAQAELEPADDPLGVDKDGYVSTRRMGKQRMEGGTKRMRGTHNVGYGMGLHDSLVMCMVENAWTCGTD